MLGPLHHIAGRWVASSTDQTIAVANPATAEVIARIPAGDTVDAATAVDAAAGAAAAWHRTPAAERAAAVKAWARRVRAHRHELARLQTVENGKPVADSAGGVDAGVGALEQYGELGPLHRGRSLVGGWDALDVMAPVPRGVAAVIVPWNDPVAIACGLVGANLVVGNTVVLKPSEKTPLHAVRLVELAEGILPDGVLNLLLGGSAAGAALVDHVGVDVVVHVGSVPTGQWIAARCARRLAKAVLELGGNDALVVDEGVDPTFAAEQIAVGAFANAGQICTSVERVFVHESVVDDVVEQLAKRVEQLVVGNGLDPETDMGPLIDEGQREVVEEHVADAVAHGAVIAAVGHRPPGPGSFHEPVVLTGVTDDMLVMREETFGPVAPVAAVASFDEALARANHSHYGLAATVLTPSQHHAVRAFRELDVGTVKVNAAFGGAPGGAAHPHKRSGSGFGYGPELLDELTRTRVLHVTAHD